MVSLEDAVFSTTIQPTKDEPLCSRGDPECAKESPYDRGSFDAVVTTRDLVETYWPQFRAAVQGAKLGGTVPRPSHGCSMLHRF
jgi:hypothetical protein